MKLQRSADVECIMGYSYVYNLQTMRHSRFNLRYNVRVINEDHKLGLKNRTKTYVPFNLMLQDVTLLCTRAREITYLSFSNWFIFHKSASYFFLNILLQEISINPKRKRCEVNNIFNLCKYL